MNFHMVEDMCIPYSTIWYGAQNIGKKVLKDGIDAECKEMLCDLAEEYKFSDSGNGGYAGSYPSACRLQTTVFISLI